MDIWLNGGTIISNNKKILFIRRESLINERGLSLLEENRCCEKRIVDVRRELLLLEENYWHWKRIAEEKLLIFGRSLLIIDNKCCFLRLLAKGCWYLLIFGQDFTIFGRFCEVNSAKLSTKKFFFNCFLSRYVTSHKKSKYYF